VPSPRELRAELEQIVIRDLLGPAGGPAEELDERSVRDRYLVGMLAPRGQLLRPEQSDELATAGAGTAGEQTRRDAADDRAALEGLDDAGERGGL
jgi:hypothetical protein